MPPAPRPIGREALTKLVQRRAPLYDKSRDGHYNLISALHKSVRGSDPDASLYWLARMLDGGEDRLYIARRLVRMAIEDIGLADPQAVVQALAAKDVYDFLGSPGGRAGAGADRGLPRHRAQIERRLHGLRRGHARRQGGRQPGAAQAHPQRADQADEEEGYGAGYDYDHGTPEAFSGQNYFPDGMARQQFYEPDGRGFEAELKKRLEHWAKLRK